MASAGANEATVAFAGAFVFIFVYISVSDIECIFVSKHDNARNAALELELTRPATKNDGAVARVACRCALGDTRLLFGIRAPAHVRIERNDNAPRTHELIQVAGTKNHGVVQYNGRIRAGIFISPPGRKSSCSSHTVDSSSR